MPDRQGTQELVLVKLDVLDEVKPLGVIELGTSGVGRISIGTSGLDVRDWVAVGDTY